MRAQSIWGGLEGRLTLPQNETLHATLLSRIDANLIVSLSPQSKRRRGTRLAFKKCCLTQAKRKLPHALKPLPCACACSNYIADGWKEANGDCVDVLDEVISTKHLVVPGAVETALKPINLF